MPQQHVPPPGTVGPAYVTDVGATRLAAGTEGERVTMLLSLLSYSIRPVRQLIIPRWESPCLGLHRRRQDDGERPRQRWQARGESHPLRPCQQPGIGAPNRPQALTFLLRTGT